MTLTRRTGRLDLDGATVQDMEDSMCVVASLHLVRHDPVASKNRNNKT
jgi:hypothetical protein